MTHPTESVRRFYDALGRGDVATVLALLDPQVQWTEAESFPYYSGTWQGPEAVVNNLLIALARDWRGFSARAHEFIASGDRVVALRKGASGRAGLAQLTYGREIDLVEAQPTYAAVRDANRTASRPRAGLPGACATGALSADTARR